MKTNKIKHNRNWSALAILALIILVGVSIGIVIGYNSLRKLWHEQCIVQSMEDQVSIESGKMVKADVIASEFGLKVGANLATIDYAAKREAALEKIPNLRNIRIRRILPDRVEISLEERKPVARLNIRGRSADTGKVVDSDGVVFMCARGTQLLPAILEPNAPGTAAGKHLSNHTRSALRLIEACHESEFQELVILDVSTADPDYLVATLNTGSTYSTLKIAWEGMNEATPAAQASLARQLTHLRDAIRSRVGDGAVIWNATDFSSPGRIYADLKGNF